MTSNPAFAERNIQKSQSLSPRFSSGAKIFGHVSHSNEFVRNVFGTVNTLTSTASIGSFIICMWSPADICERWEINLSFGSADDSEAGMRGRLAERQRERQRSFYVLFVRLFITFFTST